MNLPELFRMGGPCLAGVDAPIPGRLRAVLVLPERPDAETAAVAIEVAGRLGLDSAAYVPPVAVLAGQPLPPGRFPVPVAALGGLAAVRAAAAAGFAAPPDPAPAAPAPAAAVPGPGGLPLGSSDGLQPDRAMVRFRLTGTESPDAVLALADLAFRTGAAATGLRLPLAELPGEPERPGPLAVPPPLPPAPAPALPPASGPEPPGEPLLALEWQGQWEGRRLWSLLRERVLPVAARGSEPLQFHALLSESAHVRAGIQAEMALELAEEGVLAEIRIGAAFRQGYGWATEELLPALLARPGVARVELACRPFPAEGAPPETLAAAGLGAGPNLELPIRWLQELYPADEVIARALRLPTASVTVALAEGLGTTYRARAYDAAGALLHEAAFTAACGRRPYLPGDPAAGWVHPPTGRLQARQGALALEWRIATDMEQFWDFYQHEVLPRLETAVQELAGPAPVLAQQPYFGALAVELWASEPDEPTEIRQETVSSLDAMHEDIYFYTLDALARLGQRRCGQPFAAPGAVHPWVHAADGNPVARVRLYARAAGQPAATGAAAAGGAIPAPADLSAAVAVPAVPLQEVIGPDQLPGLLRRLQERGLHVWQCGSSLEGRPLHAVACLPAEPGLQVFPHKLAALRPTVLINGRHHANEVAGTTALLRLAELAATDPAVAELCRRVNVVLLPLENADGAALHCAMQAEHPTWKLHAARFNAAGYEFGLHYFNPVTPFPEARALPALVRAWLPDVILDNHGVPSHAWIQPFSGFGSAPYFAQSYWLPAAMLYLIFLLLDEPGHVRAAAEVRQVLAAAEAADPDLTAANAALWERYVAYGKRWLPARFPLVRTGGLTTDDQRLTAALGARKFLGRYPQVVSVEIVTEVPDETAQGAHLEQTAAAQLAADLACIGHLAGRIWALERLALPAAGGTVLLVRRRRMHE